jgi:predicted nucleotidyltransferase
MIHVQGKNLLPKFQKIADRIVSEVSALDDVAGIVVLGGVSRGFVDRYSDLDILVFLTKRNDNVEKSIHELTINEQKATGVEVDLEIHVLQDYAGRKWNEIARWDFSIAKVVFDPTGNAAKMIGDKLRVPEEFWVRRVVVSSERMKWYCCPPASNIGTIAEVSLERGDLASAHYCVNHGLDLLLAVLFALNKRFLPPPKWRIMYSRNLPWLPTNYEKRLEELLSVKSLSRNELQRRLQIVRELWSETSAKITKDMGLSPKGISEFYVERVLGQTDVNGVK